MENAQKLTAPGVIALGVTAIMMLSTIEGTFNRIWRATAKRPWPLRILAFWAVLTLGPILLGMSISVSAVFQGYSDQLKVGWLVRETRFALPFVLQFGAFSALYLAIPAAPVRFSHALVGGLVAAILFQILKLGFGYFVASAENYRTVYGALAAIPIFLLWLYSFWTLLLIGAHIAAALPERRLLGESGLIDQTTAESRLQAAMLVLRRLWQAAGARETLNLEDLDPEPSPWVLNRLAESGLIARLEDNTLIAGCDFSRAPIGVLWRARPGDPSVGGCGCAACYDNHDGCRTGFYGQAHVQIAGKAGQFQSLKVGITLPFGPRLYHAQRIDDRLCPHGAPVARIEAMQRLGLAAAAGDGQIHGAHRLFG